MTDIPASAREFTRWFDERSPEWPSALFDAGIQAMLSLDYLDQPAENRSPRTDEMARRDLFDFATAYAEWKTNNGQSR